MRNEIARKQAATKNEKLKTKNPKSKQAITCLLILHFSFLVFSFSFQDALADDEPVSPQTQAAKLILDAQKVPQGPHAGGWRYQANSADADISVTGWQLMALRGAANCGAAVPKEVLDKGVAYIRRLAVPKDQGGGFGYQNGG